jgi:hypothetical protein
MRLHIAAEAINHALRQIKGDSAFCITEVGFKVASQDGCATSLAVRRKVSASGRSQYSAKKRDHAPAADTWLSEQLDLLSMV